MATPELTISRLAGGPASNSVLVVGPSLGTSVDALWARCAGGLAPDFEVFGWDLPGHGRSVATKAAFDVPDLAEGLRHAVDSLASGRPLFYAGVSLGGAIGLQLALDPGQFRSAVAIASAPKFGEPQQWTDRADLVRREGVAVMVEGSAHRWFAPGFIEREPPIADALLTSLAEVDAESYALACLALAQFDLTSHLSDAKVPLLFAPGELDVVISPDSLRTIVSEAEGHQLVTLPGCGHLPPAEAPMVVAKLLGDFTAAERRRQYD